MSGMQTQPYQDFAKNVLGFEFNDIQLLVTALTHRSYVNEHKKSVSEHNERLEFLGDAVLELVVTNHLYRNFNDAEGTLTSWRAALVRTESIGEAGIRLGYEPLVRMSRGEKQGGDRARQQILANAFEAVTGAIYLERGYDAAAEFINKYIISKLDGILETGSWRDAKSHLQEVSQRIDSQTPQYRVVEEVGPDHDKIFTLGVYVADKLMGIGSGPSKQVAQQQAAQAALDEYAKR
ncbi:ribonuclease III [Candidatus Saccharibacteria bacterium CG11_big_fil_rev_8_21_14_0_20_41_19]|nr:ribonuclease III [Candidatus Saccharibacteria bacterium]PIQ70655.1 MAG: ribonuclease III [Candidatus Saccharibacteria bacterium CG11_big_fil_rev_8_21_14_0_20_41_19]PIZ59573.1 MAG: ribonuclease III [Candidatus Saccharibacteria bacterium CG_4_10_14_0_2_um_filter_41_11]PJC29756.1 MAG: ribonuclease III [Candidatus Saccharibacteria bacterium CG_4_9_14_0_2_um_filter_41_9]PJE66211.1 MAG: ribonuclease III [Candidatus Saccharibacteria bacterium CG10_big_fil_rev_8_21_14_0_10_41_32]